MEYTYLHKIKKILDKVFTSEDEAIQKSIDIIYTAIHKKNSIFSFGASHAGILTEEMYYRAGGLVVINPIFGKEVMLDTLPITHTSKMETLLGYGCLLAEKTPFKNGDILIVHSVSGRNPVTIELAKKSKEKGVIVICITNLAYSKHVTSRLHTGEKLYNISDIVIDNCGEKGDACVSIDGIKQKVAPTSTVIGATIINCIVSEVAKKLAQNGANPPPIFYSANIDGGKELNEIIYNKYKNQIHYKYN